MNDIQFMEKPDWVPWKDVCDCIHDANIVNDKRGFHMPFADITPEEIEKELENGKCFIALRDGKVIGTGSYRIRNLRKWYAWGKAVYYCLDGIRPEYQGTDVYFGIAELRDRSIKETGIKIFQFHTSEKNKTVIKLNLKYGYKFVMFRPNAEEYEYYSVTMLKWEDGCPFPDWYLKSMFNLSKYISKIFFTPNSKFRPSLKRL